MLELLIKGGLVIDGTGQAGYLADIGIESGKIAVIDRTRNLNAEAQKVIDAKGKMCIRDRCCSTFFQGYKGPM